MRYNRERAVEYARRHVLCTRAYRSGKDADATAFVSRCIAAGFGIDFECTDPEQLGRFMPDKFSARECELSDVREGDIVQIRQRPGLPYKSLIVTDKNNETVLVTAHSYISVDRQIDSYSIHNIRCFNMGC